MKPAKKDIVNVPNALSVVRILLIPVFIYLYLNDRDVWATIALVVSGLTDCVDGFVARRFNQITELGKILDPAADKLTQAAVAVAVAIRYPQIAPLLVVFILKELLMLLGSLKLLRSGQRPAASKWWGKLATIVFYVAMILVVAFGAWMGSTVITILVACAAVFMIFSFINYIPLFFQSVKESKEEKDEEIQEGAEDKNAR